MKQTSQPQKDFQKASYSLLVYSGLEHNYF